MHLTDLLQTVGILLIAAAVGLVLLPAGFLVAGLLLIVQAEKIHRDRP